MWTVWISHFNLTAVYKNYECDEVIEIHAESYSVWQYEESEDTCNPTSLTSAFKRIQTGQLTFIYSFVCRSRRNTACFSTPPTAEMDVNIGEKVRRHVVPSEISSALIESQLSL